MTGDPCNEETMVERRVTYVLQSEGKLMLIENVPARVCLETGERFFSPRDCGASASLGVGAT